MDWTWTIVTFFLRFHLTQGTPYDLFQGSPYTGEAHRHRNRNWCAYVVPRNVSCAVQGGVESFEEPVAAPCPPYQQGCDQQVTYRTQYRPVYKISFKRVTQLEWRCCPGFQGPDCKDMKPALNHQTVHRTQPYFPPNPGHTTRHIQRPERRETGHHEARRGGPDKVHHLEGEVKRLSQVVVDLQTALSGLTDNLRTDIQEDTNKMLVSLLNNLRPPNSAVPGAEGSEENPVVLDGHQATRGAGDIGDSGIKNILARLDDMSNAMKSKDEGLEELRGLVARQEGQIQLLMDAARPLVPPAVLDGGADGGGVGISPPDLDILQTYIDTKLEKMKNELDLSVEGQLAKQQSACSDKIQTLQGICEEGQHQTLTTVTRLVDAKENQLRKEIHALRFDMVAADGPVRTLRQTVPAKQEEDSNHKDLWREISRVAEANIILNARMDNELAYLSEPPQPDEERSALMEEFEARLNITEQNAETHCFYIEEKLSHAIEDEANALRRLLDERLNTLEDQFTNMLVEISNSSGLFRDAGMHTGQAENDANNVLSKRPVDTSERTGSEAVVSPGNGSPTTTGLDHILRDLGRSRSELEILHTEVGENSDKLRNLEDTVELQSVSHLKGVKTMDDFHKGLINLQNNMIGLANGVNGLGDSVRTHSHELQKINSTCCLAGQSGPGTTGTGHRVDIGQQQQQQQQLEALRNRLDALNNLMSLELGRCNENVQTATDSVSTMDGRLTRLEKVGERQTGASSIPALVRDGMERKIANLQDSVLGTNATVGEHTSDIRSLQNSLQSLQAQLSAMAKHGLKNVTAKQPGTTLNTETPGSLAPPPPDPGHTVPRRIPHIHIPFLLPHGRQAPSVVLPSTHHRQQQPGVPPPPLSPSSPSSPSSRRQPAQRPSRPVVETGEAGPPGFLRRVTVRRGSEDSSSVPVQGFAGAPGHFAVRPVSFKSHLKPVPVAAKIPWNRAHLPPVRSAVLADTSFMEDPFSFSAGFTQQRSFSGDFGPVLFDRVLVNDGGHYNPTTGIFTAPVAGRYLVSGVLTSRPGDRLEAVLSVANRSVQRLRSSAMSPRSLGGGSGGGGCGGCGGSVSFSLILALRKGDGVGLVRTAGQLATSEAREMLSTYSGVFLYAPPPAHR